MEKLAHIGIAVKDLGVSSRLFEKLLRRKPYKTETVISEDVRTAFFQIGDVKIELLESTMPNSPIARFIQKRGEGVHHLAFETADINESLAHYKAHGIEAVTAEPAAGADNKLIAFLHPKSTNGVLTELCQEKPNTSS